MGKTNRDLACSRGVAGRLWKQVSLVGALIMASGCGGPAEEVVVTSTVTSTQTTTVTPADWPDQDCLPPIVESFEIDWERKFGPGIPPMPKPGESIGHNYFASYAPKKATVRLLNLSPNNIYVRGVDFQVSWMDPDREIHSTGYKYGVPVGAIPDPYFGSIPEHRLDRLAETRSPKMVYGRDSREFSREYSGVGDVRVAGGGEPHSWVEPGGIDWWFADPDDRQRCAQN